MKYFNQRTDQVNLMPIFAQNNFEIDSILRPHPEAEKVGYLLAQEDMPKMSEGRGPFLQEAADLAIKNLSKNDRGFFMMVEASQIDWGGHDNDFPYMLSELIDLDDTLGFLLNFARTDQNTLIVVTGDHATGGFSLSADDDSYDKINPTFGTVTTQIGFQCLPMVQALNNSVGCMKTRPFFTKLSPYSTFSSRRSCHIFS